MASLYELLTPLLKCDTLPEEDKNNADPSSDAQQTQEADMDTVSNNKKKPNQPKPKKDQKVSKGRIAKKPLKLKKKKKTTKTEKVTKKKLPLT